MGHPLVNPTKGKLGLPAPSDPKGAACHQQLPVQLVPAPIISSKLASASSQECCLFVHKHLKNSISVTTQSIKALADDVPA